MLNQVALYPFDKITRGLIRFRDLLQVEIRSVIDFTCDHTEDIGSRLGGETTGIPMTNDIEKGLQQVDILIVNDLGNNPFADPAHNLAEKWRTLVKCAYEKGITIISLHEIVEPGTKQWLRAHEISLQFDDQLDHELLADMDMHPLRGKTELERYFRHLEADHTGYTSSPSSLRVGIFATRGCLGKFTTQMSLFRQLKKRGRSATSIITEPTAFLFQQPSADIFKFLATQTIDQYPYYIQTVAKKAEQAGSPYILLAGQGALLPHHDFLITSNQVAYLKAFDPDAILLVVEYEDDQKIRDSLDFLRIYGYEKPIQLLLPDRMETGLSEIVFKTPAEMAQRKQQLESQFDIPVVYIKQPDQIADRLEQLREQKEHAAVML
ncbi:DUF1611 domain-containing protein [Marinicrinis sediminis]|uniref:DUF1611 domain-containing protein n=1 Tax=Marinicrinis sediminis TaxID=1652465 RepID=A0ABW5R950_9BACL